MILVPVEIKDNVLHAIYRNAGLKSEGKGIAFSLPVDDVVGISAPPLSSPIKSDEKTEPEKQQEENKEKKS